MHFISEIRHNSESSLDERYYRVKESFRDLTGRVHCRILLNAGFISPDPSPEDIRDVCRCLNWMQSHRDRKKEPGLFGSSLSRMKLVNDERERTGKRTGSPVRGTFTSRPHSGRKSSGTCPHRRPSPPKPSTHWTRK